MRRAIDDMSQFPVAAPLHCIFSDPLPYLPRQAACSPEPAVGSIEIPGICWVAQLNTASKRTRPVHFRRPCHPTLQTSRDLTLVPLITNIDVNSKLFSTPSRDNAAMASNSTPLDFTTFHNVIDGKLVGTAKTRHTVSPSTLEENPPLPLSTAEDVDKAVAAAQKAAKQWAEVPWDERKKALEGFIEAFESHSEDFVQMLNKEQGKPVSGHLYVFWLPLLTS